MGRGFLGKGGWGDEGCMIISSKEGRGEGKGR